MEWRRTTFLRLVHLTIAENNLYTNSTRMLLISTAAWGLKNKCINVCPANVR